VDIRVHPRHRPDRTEHDISRAGTQPSSANPHILDRRIGRHHVHRQPPVATATRTDATVVVRARQRSGRIGAAKEHASDGLMEQTAARLRGR